MPRLHLDRNSRTRTNATNATNATTVEPTIGEMKANEAPLPSGASSIASLHAPKSKIHPALVVRSGVPASSAVAREVVYSKTAGEFAALSEKALDVVEGPYSQRARRARKESSGGAPTYSEVMSELRAGNVALGGSTQGASSKLAQHVMKRVVDAHTALGIGNDAPPGLAHLRAVDARAIASLEPWEQKLLTNGAGRFPSMWLDLDSAIFNGLSMTFHRCMRDDGTIDASLVAKEMSPMAAEVLGLAVEGFANKDGALQHWASGDRSAYEPDDRPITRRDVDTLKQKDPALLEQLLEAAPIPQSLPVVDATTQADATRLDDFAVVMVQHALGSIVPFTDALRNKGATDLEFVPVPYSTNALVAEKLARNGVRIHDSCPTGTLAPRDVEKIMERDVARALRAALEKSKVTGKKMLVVDDGGIVLRLLSGRAKTLPPEEARELALLFRDVPVRIVEQTTRGITEALAAFPPPQGLPKNITLVDMARSEAKAFEGPMVGKDAHVVLDRAMKDCGKGGVKDKQVLLVGFGVIGANVARALRDAGAKVVIHDVDEATRERARAEGFEVADVLEDGLRDKHLVVGCSGHRSVSREAFFAMRSGTVLASLSSKAMELFTDHVDGAMSAVMYPAEGHGEAPVASFGRAFKHHQIVDSRTGDDVQRGVNGFEQVVYYLVNSGCPATFTGHVNAVPPEDIQLTEGIKLEAVLQAANSDVGCGITALAAERQTRVLRAMDEARPGWRSS